MPQLDNNNISNDLEFDVMPKDDGDFAPKKTKSKSALKPPPGPHKKTSKARVWAISVGSILVLAVLAFLVYAYVFNGLSRGGEDSPDITVPTGGAQEKDSDNDGLSDRKENELGTQKDNADTDNDGLADGDEVNIYGSDPLLVDTDLDTFSDGQEVADGFDPTVNTTKKAGEEVLQRWAEKIAEFGLHDPTNNTLISKKNNIGNQTGAVYQNEAYGFSVDVPQVLSSSESPDKRNVGFYVTGTEPDLVFESNPISITVAISVEGQSLGQWIDEFYSQGVDYSISEDVTFPNSSGVALSDVVVDRAECNSSKTLYKFGNDVVIVTILCNQSSEFGILYNQIVNSFKFTR